MADALTQRFEDVAIDELEPWPGNPRRSDVGSITTSIDANGFYGAVIAQRSTKRIIAGHGRWLAARAHDFERVPVLWLDVDDEQAQRILVADNRTSDLAVWDEQELAGFLASLDGALLGTGFTQADLDALIASPPDEFQQLGADLETEHRCPRCGYEWSGSPNP